MSDQPGHRWSDQQLQAFHDEFRLHIKDEKVERDQQQEIHEALFRKEDVDSNVSPGIVQMMTRIDRELKDMRIWQDRQKTFAGGVIFATSSVWFLFSDGIPKLLAFLKRF